MLLASISFNKQLMACCWEWYEKFFF